MTMLLLVAEILGCAVLAVVSLQTLMQIGELCVAAVALADEPLEAEGDLVWRRSGAAAPPVSIIAPAYNEEATVVESVRSLLGLRYPEFEIIVVNDGSRDRTLTALRRAFDLRPMERSYQQSLAHAPIRSVFTAPMHPNLIVVDKQNGGKADALNAGINLSRLPLFCCIDADSILESDALLRAARPFVEDPERVVATGGTVRVANGCSIRSGRVQHVGLSRNPLALLQTVEYIRAFQLARLAWSRIGALTIISGAFGLFRRSAVIEAGGYKRDTVGEDIELVVRLHRRARERALDQRIVFVPEPVCWTEAPETLADLSRQRRRWQRGAIETFVAHKAALGRGHVGRFGLGRLLLVDVAGPVAELAGWVLFPAFWAMGALSFDYVAAFFALSVGFGVAISVTAMAMQEAELSRTPRVRDLALLAGVAALENFGYRQLNAFWRVAGLADWLRGRTEWGAMTRRGFRAQPS